MTLQLSTCTDKSHLYPHKEGGPHPQHRRLGRSWAQRRKQSRRGQRLRHGKGDQPPPRAPSLHCPRVSDLRGSPPQAQGALRAGAAPRGAQTGRAGRGSRDREPAARSPALPWACPADGGATPPYLHHCGQALDIC